MSCPPFPPPAARDTASLGLGPRVEGQKATWMETFKSKGCKINEPATDITFLHVYTVLWSFQSIEIAMLSLILL